LFALAAKFGLKIQQMDVDIAFLYGTLDEEIFMEQAPEFVQDGDLVCRSRRACTALNKPLEFGTRLSTSSFTLLA